MLVLGKASVCISVLYGTKKVEFMCVHFVSVQKQGSDTVDVLSQVDNGKEDKMGVGWCCWRGVLWVLRLALGPGSAYGCGQVTFFIGLVGKQGKGILCAKNHDRNFSSVISFWPWLPIFWQEETWAQGTCDLFRVPQQEAICFARTEIVNAWFFVFFPLALLLFPPSVGALSFAWGHLHPGLVTSELKL